MKFTGRVFERPAQKPMTSCYKVTIPSDENLFSFLAIDRDLKAQVQLIKLTWAFNG